MAPDLVARRALPLVPELASPFVRGFEAARRRWGATAWRNAFLFGSIGFVSWFFRELNLAIPSCDEATWDCDALLTKIRAVGGALLMVLAALLVVLRVAIQTSQRQHRRWVDTLQQDLAEIDATTRDAFLNDWAGPEAPTTRLRPILHLTMWSVRVLLLGAALLFIAGLKLIEEHRTSGLVVQEEYLALGVIAVLLVPRTRRHLKILRSRLDELLSECELALAVARGDRETTPSGHAPTFRPWSKRSPTPTTHGDSS